MFKTSCKVGLPGKALRPDALGKFLFILRKNLSPVRWDKCARWFLDLPNFVKAYQTSKTPSSCLRAGQIFVRCENRTDFAICTAWSKEKVFKCAHDYQIENLAETNFVEIFGRTKQILSVQWIRTLCEEQPSAISMSKEARHVVMTDIWRRSVVQSPLMLIQLLWFTSNEYWLDARLSSRVLNCFQANCFTCAQKKRNTGSIGKWNATRLGTRRHV